MVTLDFQTTRHNCTHKTPAETEFESIGQPDSELLASQLHISHQAYLKLISLHFGDVNFGP